jgi:hypothetical protein
LVHRFLFFTRYPAAQTPNSIAVDAPSTAGLRWQKRYAMRAGAEATVSETVRAHRLRHCRYHGLAETHVQHVLTAAGTDIIRLSEQPPADRRRRSPSNLHRLG